MGRLNVLLIRPYSEAEELTPPFGLGYLAAAVRKNHNVEILDCLKDNVTLERFEGYLSKDHYDVIGIQVFTCNIDIVKKYTEAIRENHPKSYIVIGGPHPSSSPEDIFDIFPLIDFGFKGEAEIGLPKLLDYLADGKSQSEDIPLLEKVPGFIWRNNGKVIANSQLFVEDLDSLGYPAWDLINPSSYPPQPHGSFLKNYPIAPIIVTRGCPYHCTYCCIHLISGRKIRKRSINNVIDEIKLLYYDYRVREIHIEDDNFTFYPDLVKEFCSKLIEANLNISWTCPNGVRLDTLSKELLELMKKAGLYGLSVGIESGSDKILKDMRKQLTKEKIKEKIKLIKDIGLKCKGFFILGYPTETKEDILNTLAFSRELPLTQAAFNIFQPFPGTEITNFLISQNRINLKEVNFANFILRQATYAPFGISPKELRNLRRRGLFRFYVRPKILFGVLRDIKSFAYFKTVMKRFLNYLNNA